MREVDGQIQELYTQYKADKIALEQQESAAEKPITVFQRVAKRFRKDKGQQDSSTKRGELFEVRCNLEDLIGSTPGKHPLLELKFGRKFPFEYDGFSFGFNYPVGEDNFSVDYFYSSDLGILAQKQPSDHAPEIEVLGDEDERGPTLLHLPDGFKVPVGPLYFESDSVPLTQHEFDTTKRQILKNAVLLGYDYERVRNGPFPSRKYTSRYFYWQPELPDDPQRIAIDFDGIEPYHMTLSLEQAPVFNKTSVLT